MNGAVERLATDSRSPWWGEHLSRYVHGSTFASGRTVLDIACGTGYGSVALAEAGGRFIVGCDLAVEPLAEANRRSAGKAVSYVSGSGLELPFAPTSFDLVVSFETIEHLTDRTRFLKELHRVLKPDGVLLLSTPNAEVTSAYPPNPFHVHEYTPAELSGQLSAVFSEVELFGQRPAPRYAVTPLLPGYDRPRGVAQRVEMVVWKLLRRLPARLGEAAARILLGRQLYPTSIDFQFTDSTDRAHVLLARCRP
jgi:SAM-dependent methyltransferase